MAGWKKSIYRMVNDFKPHIVLFINLPQDMLNPNDLKYIQDRAKTICWFVDGVSIKSKLIECLKFIGKIYVFENQDTELLRQYSIPAEYLPVGYSEVYKKSKNKRDIDVIFIGSPFHNRLLILENIAAAASRENWNLQIYGPFYDEKYPWKKMLFKRSYPQIYHYLRNGSIKSDVAAALYRRTKICLNIHDVKHSSVNPRTFEIMATGSFEIMDSRKCYDIICSKTDVGVFENAADAIEKIKYYLKNDEARERMAESGYNKIINRRSMLECLAYILQE